MNTAKTEDGVTDLDTVDLVPKLLESLPSEPSELSDEQRESVADLLHRYKDVFSSGELDVGRTHLITHQIDTSKHRPVRQLLRRHLVAYLESIDGYVKHLLENDIIELSAGPWSSNIVIVNEKMVS